MTRLSDLSAVNSKLEILNEILIYPGLDITQTIKDHIQTLEADRSVLMEYKTRDLKTIVKDIESGKIKDSYRGP